MARTQSDEGMFAQPGHDQGFGPVCRYKDGESHVCKTAEELAEYDKNGWEDTPQPKKEAKPNQETKFKKAEK